MNALRRPLARRTALVLLVSLLYEYTMPIASYALTGGPSQPEFSSFEPVGTSNMVNVFNGGLTYNLPVLNIPGPSGSGYALSLSYHAGTSEEEVPSWVGYGWTLNPGSIMRGTRGLPDDYKGASVRYWNKVKDNWTVTVGFRANTEVFSKDWLKVKADMTVRYNNYKGFGSALGIGLDVKGIVDVGYTVNDGEGSFDFSVNPIRLLGELTGLYTEDMKNPLEEGSEFGIGRMVQHVIGKYLDMSGPGYYNSHSFGSNIQPPYTTSYSGHTINFSVNVQGDPAPIQAGFNGGLTGSYSIQQSVPMESDQAYGYMYSGVAGAGSVMDYYYEKDDPFTNLEESLGIPFTNADNFIVTGEGIGGGFRLFNRKTGHFKANDKKSESKMYQLGGDVHLGLDPGVGGSVGVGSHTLEVKNWNDGGANAAYTFSSSGDEPYYFRFNNDPGGSIELGGSDDTVTASLSERDVDGDKFYPVVPSGLISSSANGGKRVGRSSYIGYSTNAEMTEVPRAGCSENEWGHVPFKAYNKSGSSRDFVDRWSGVQDGVGEFAIVRPDGNRYIYGLPVYSRNEKTLRFGLEGLASNKIQKNHIAYKGAILDAEDDDLVVVGEERDAPYATTYLLTEITTPDYIDRTNDGPTADDLGGYTKFNYRQAAGTKKKNDPSSALWYRWRIPYRGLMYDRNSLSEPRDDMGSVMRGDKEIYYLASIETKTHIAFFDTDSLRYDGFDAVHDEFQAASNENATTAALTGNRLRKLNKIRLYVKDAAGAARELLTTVNFAYDYSICRNLPNSAKLNGADTSEGKLTLRRVWFDRQGTLNARISPYEFGYEYRPSSYFSALPASLTGASGADTGQYYHAVRHGDQWSAAQQNPKYSPFNIDRWGYYQYNGESRHEAHNPWVDQVPAPAFDPAAWQLKTIKLPSGGEIHIQYEQNDYRYVQHEPAMCMVNLRPASGSNQIYDDSQTPNRYYLDLDSLGLSDTPLTGGAYLPEVVRLRALLEQRFKIGKERMFFKFLYSLTDRDPNLTNCTSEYMSGYVVVKDVGLDPGGNGLYVDLGASGDYTLPRQLCLDFVTTSRANNLNKYGHCSGTRPPLDNNAEPERIVRSLHGSVSEKIDPDLACKKLHLQNSYLRIPAPRAKKGGGIRVKRLLMYDPGIESGDAALYGSEYFYIDENGLSSGVATNEPNNGREENALVGYTGTRTGDGWDTKIIAGRDLQFEGPVGESIMPGASIGYSRVVVRDIHSGKTNTGFAVHEFYTMKDYPSDLANSNDPQVTHLGFRKTLINQKEETGMIAALAYNYRVMNLYRTQGFRFVLASMHGQMKRMASYGGSYANVRNAVPIEEQVIEYYKPGEKIPMMYGHTISDTVHAYPGKEVEVTLASRSVEDVTDDFNLELDFTVGLFFIPFPLVGAFPATDFGEAKQRTHVTSKVIRYPAIQKSVTITRDGVTQTTENIAFNPESGQPMLQRTTDGYHGLALQRSNPHDGSYYSYTVPGSQQYSSLGQKAMVERTIINSTSGVSMEKRYFNNRHYLYINGTVPGALNDVLAKLTSGDLVEIVDGSSYLGVYHVGTIVGNKVELLATYPAHGFASTEAKRENVEIRIIRSGRSNRLDVSVGSVTTYGTPPTATKNPLY